MSNIDLIIPHYNRASLLKRCLDSVPPKAYIHIIVVDDGSSKMEIAQVKQVCNKRNDTKLILSKHYGEAGTMRNIGLKYATASWLLFADADDFFTEEAWDYIEQQLESNADIVYFGITSKNSGTLQPTDRYKTYDKYVQTYALYRTTSNEEWLRFRHDVPWGKMIKRSLVVQHSVQFDSTQYCNDTIFSTLTALYARTIDAFPNAIYCVTDCDNSLTSQVSPTANLVRYTVTLRKNRILQKNKYGKYQISVRFYFRQAIEAKCKFRDLLQMVILALKYHANLFIASNKFQANKPNE